MLNRKTALKKIIAFVKCCQENDITFNKVILFGSVVNGNIRRYSDIDVAFVSDRFTGHPVKDWQMLTLIKIKSRDFISSNFSIILRL
ncbi:MAG: nucleotidyltransferase domain-containing protein [Bacteroidota bacterium]